MSFNPPRKSAYGDELVDDIDGNLSQKTSFSPPPTTDRPTSYNLHQETQTSTNPPATGLPAITQEDMIFIRSWQHDSYIKRVIPLTAISFGAYYLYNKSRQLPNKFSRYFGISALSYVVGRFAYQGELKKRLSETDLDTPYIDGLRKGLGVVKIKSELSGGSGFYDGTSPQSSSAWNSIGDGGGERVDNNTPLSSRLRQNYVQQPINTHESSFGNPHGDGSVSSEAPKQTTYEELRARNRGYMK